MIRKKKLVTGEVYHIYSKSIAGFKIFNNCSDFARAIKMLRYYQIENMPLSFSRFIALGQIREEGFNRYFNFVSQGKDKNIQIIAYCFMPTHLHLVLKQLKNKGISIFMGNFLNSYSRYFNTTHKRKGPLWQGRFENVLVSKDEQLFHLTRYIHLNPVTAYLVDKPQQWLGSSYCEYLLKVKGNDRICEYDDILEVEPTAYKSFVEDRISYQRELAAIKDLLLED